MTPLSPLLLSAVALALLAGCATNRPHPPVARAHLEARSGSAVQGTVTFTPHGEATLVEAQVTGLTPGEHGFHVHDSGDCSAPDATSAKGHFNPMAQAHGHHRHSPMQRHAGDLPNLVADAQGRAHYRAEVQGLQLKAGAEGVVQRSVVVHADPDDHTSQPAGNSGKRVACGTIQPL